jgi:hypothetical protein
MNKLKLPPKRFEDPEQPCFDSIRFKPWYAKLYKRREKIPMLAAARQEWVSTKKSQIDVCVEFGISEREFRDYTKYASGVASTCPIPDDVLQYAIDAAYIAYCNDNASDPFTRYIEGAAKLFGINPRQLSEQWETVPSFFPTLYERNK